MTKEKTVNLSRFRSLFPFESRYLDINGLNYHYLDEGIGLPVVMIHGNPTWSFYFRSLIAALSSYFRIIVPDHIGCGLSEKPDMRTYDYRLKSRINDFIIFLDKLKIDKKITLVLHDWGGMIGMAYAVKYPERISRIILLNTAAFFPPEGKLLPLRLRLIRDVPFFSIPAVLGLNLFSLGALFMASEKKLPKDIRSGLIAPYNCWQNRIATLKFVQDIPLNPKDPSYHLVKSVSDNLFRLEHLPILICWGMNDFVFDEDYLKEWRRRFPNAKVNRVENAGHYVLEDAPETVIYLIKDFLNINNV